MAEKYRDSYPYGIEHFENQPRAIESDSMMERPTLQKKAVFGNTTAKNAIPKVPSTSSATPVKPPIDAPAITKPFPMPPSQDDVPKTISLKGEPSAAIPSIAKPVAQPLREMTAQETWDSRSVDPRTALQHADDDLAKQGVLWTDRRSPAMLGIKQTMADKEVAQQNTLRTGIQSRIKDELTAPDTAIHNKALMYNQDVASTGLADLRKAEASKHTSDAAKSKKEIEVMPNKEELMKSKQFTDMYGDTIKAYQASNTPYDATQVARDVKAALEGKVKRTTPAIPMKTHYFKADEPEIPAQTYYENPNQAAPATTKIGSHQVTIR